jgi:hypothetical protein
MNDVLLWIENLSYSTWLRESLSLWAFPLFLFAHTLGMSMVAGGATIINLAFLGVWPKHVPIKALERLYPLLWAGFWLNAFTGVSIFMREATNYGRNPVLYVKLLFVFAGVGLLLAMRKRVFDEPDLDRGPVPRFARWIAGWSLFCWFAAIIAGRLIAYTGSVH